MELASPCVDLCRMDGADEFCIGCYRTLDEIVRWANASDDEKREILAAVAQRRGRLDPEADLNCKDR
ncbi:MAG: DUF1289 domain-containing protein [Rhodocyclales bacterium]|nr:DUF1289 domain-containing protein [Rhodocyclales bacterium]